MNVNNQLDRLVVGYAEFSLALNKDAGLLAVTSKLCSWRDSSHLFQPPTSSRNRVCEYLTILIAQS